jgi:hypothetical protein
MYNDISGIKQINQVLLMKNNSLSSNQDIGNDQEPKPAHAHFCSSAFLDGAGSNAFTRSSVVNVHADKLPIRVPTLEQHLKGAYNFLEM